MNAKYKAWVEERFKGRCLYCHKSLKNPKDAFCSRECLKMKLSSEIRISMTNRAFSAKMVYERAEVMIDDEKEICRLRLEYDLIEDALSRFKSRNVAEDKKISEREVFIYLFALLKTAHITETIAGEDLNERTS